MPSLNSYHESYYKVKVEVVNVQRQRQRLVLRGEATLADLQSCDYTTHSTNVDSLRGRGRRSRRLQIAMVLVVGPSLDLTGGMHTRARAPIRRTIKDGGKPSLSELCRKQECELPW
jgi:hypothetical protein